MCGLPVPFAGLLSLMCRCMPIITGLLLVSFWERKHRRLSPVSLIRRRFPDGYGCARSYRTGGW